MVENSLKKIADTKGLSSATRHLFICIGPKCCSNEVGLEVWTHVKDRTKELNLTTNSVMRSKVGCLRVCAKGPVAVIYPEGIWYHSVDKKFADKLIEEFLVKGNEVEENQFLRNDLKG